MKILVAYPTRPSFVARDIKILSSRHEVSEHQFLQPGLQNQLRGIRRLARTNVLYLWFASVRALPLVLAATLLRKQVVIVVGGYEAANCPEIAYGNARFRFQRMLTSWMLRRSRAVLAVSAASRESILSNLSVPQERVHLLYHGFEDIAAGSSSAKTPVVLTVGRVDSSGWRRKGLSDFLIAAEQLPDIEFVLVGSVEVDLEGMLGRTIPDNVRLAGQLPFERVGEYYRSAKVYLQPSYHESFGCAVAEAMLFRCIPVVRNAYSLPEVVGDTGVKYSGAEGDTPVMAIKRALQMTDASGDSARERVLTEFSYERRREALLSVLEGLAV